MHGDTVTDSGLNSSFDSIQNYFFSPESRGFGSFNFVTLGNARIFLRRHAGVALRCCRNACALAVSALIVTSCSNSGNPQLIPHQSEIVVGAASDLRFAFTQLGEDFTKETGVRVQFSFGSSGQLKEQIINGAPFDLFASANEKFVQDVVEAGRGWPDTVQLYALGRVAIRTRSGVDVPTELSDLVRSDFTRIAIANPEHAPYGIAAREALISAGIYSQVQDRLIFGENVSDTLRLVETGNVDAAIVALSLVINGSSSYHLVDARLHQPLNQSLVVTRTGKNEKGARLFTNFLSSVEARSVMQSYGFELSQVKK
jgi:molybdate transport system substrate-binding protein